MLEKIAGLWPRAKELFRGVPNAAAKIVLDQIENWCLPQRLPCRAPDESIELLRTVGRRMVCDVLELPNCNRAWRSWAARVSRYAEFDLSILVDEMFEAIYADRDFSEDWDVQHSRRISELEALADTFRARPITELIESFAEIEMEARELDIWSHSYFGVIYQRIATTCANPVDWFDALFARRAPCNFLMPFVHRMSLAPPDVIEGALARLLEIPEYQALAANRVLHLDTASESLISSALGLLATNEMTVDDLWLGQTVIPSPTMQRLLENSSRTVRAAAAIGEWRCNPSGTIRDELAPAWRKV
jgi:hypothetical protein